MIKIIEIEELTLEPEKKVCPHDCMENCEFFVAPFWCNSSYLGWREC